MSATLLALPFGLAIGLLLGLVGGGGGGAGGGGGFVLAIGGDLTGGFIRARGSGRRRHGCPDRLLRCRRWFSHRARLALLLGLPLTLLPAGDRADERRGIRRPPRQRQHRLGGRTHLHGRGDRGCPGRPPRGRPRRAAAARLALRAVPDRRCRFPRRRERALSRLSRREFSRRHARRRRRALP